MGRKLELVYEDEEANPAVATQKAEKLFQVGKVDFPHRHGQLWLDPGRGAGGRAQQPLDRDHGVLRRLDHGRQVQSQRVPRQRVPACRAPRWPTGWPRRKRMPTSSTSGPTTRWAAARWRRSRRRPRAGGRQDVGGVRAAGQQGTYSPYFGQIRGARPTVIYTRWPATTRCACSRRWPSSASTATCRSSARRAR